MRRRRFIVLITVIPLIVFLIAAAAFMYSQIRNVQHHASVIFVDELERTLNRHVTVSRFDTSKPGTMVAEDLKILSGKSETSKPFFTAKRMVVKYRLWDMVLGRTTPAQSVKSIRFESPTLQLIRAKNGVWNIADFFKPKPGPRRPPFKGVVIIANGTATFTDYVTRLPHVPTRNKFNNVNLVFDASGVPVYSVDAAMNAAYGRSGRIRVVGTGNSTMNSWEFNIAAKNADASYWTRYFVQPGVIAVSGGRMDVSLTIAYRPHLSPTSRFEFTGAAKLKNASVAVEKLRQPARQLSGTVTIARRLAAFNLRGNIAGSPIAASGNIINLQTNPRLNIRIKSDKMNYASVRSIVELPESLKTVQLYGVNPLTIDVLGNFSSPIVKVDASVPRASAAGYQATNLKAQAIFNNGALRITRATGNTLGGSAVVSGSIDTGRVTRLNLSGQAKGVNVAALPFLRTVSTRGRADAVFKVTGTSISPVVAMDVQVGSGNLNMLRFARANGHLTVTGKRVDIASSNVAVAGGVIRASGSVLMTGKLNLRTTAVGVDLGRLLGALGIKQATGRAYASGALTGTVSNPQFAGQAEIYNGHFASYGFDYARGELIASKSRVSLTDATIRLFPSEVTVTGSITNIATARPSISASVRVSEAQVPQLLQILNVNADIKGRISGNLKVSGRYPDISVTGDLMVRDGSVMGFPVSSAVASISYKNGITSIRSAIAQSEEANLSATGTIDRRGVADIQFALAGFSLARLAPYTRPYVDLSGALGTISGRVTGPIKNPTLTAALAAENLMINGENFSKLAAAGSVSKEGIALNQLMLARGGQELAFDTVQLNSAADTINVKGRANCIQISSILALINGSPYVRDIMSSPVQTGRGEQLRTVLAKIPTPTEGVLSLDFSATGALSEPDATVKGAVTDVTVGPTQVSRVGIDIASSKNAITVNELAAVGREATIRVEPGVIYQDGSLNADITANNINAATVGSLVGHPEVRGTASVDASIQGPVKSPQIVASLEVVQPKLEGLSFDRLRASRIEVGQSSIQMSDIILTSGGYRAVASGTIPWNWQTLKVPSDKPIEFQADIPKQELAVVALFTNALSANETKGQIEGNVSITGTISNPNLSGHLGVTDGRLAFNKIETPLNDIQASVDFSGDRLIVQQLSGKSEAGGTFTVTPGGYISLARNEQRRVDLAVNTKDFIFRSRNLAGYGEYISSTVNSDVTVTGDLLTPVIAGNAGLTNGTFTVAPPAVLPALGKAGMFNPKFDLHVSVGPNVEFLNPRIRTTLVGLTDIGGTLASPNVQGQFQLTRGDIRLPTARFTIQPGSAVSVEYTPERMRVVPNIEARTSLSATSPLGTRKRYTIIMTVKGTVPPAESLRVSLRSDPADLSQQQILASIGHAEDLFGGGEVALRQELGSVFTAVAVPTLLEPIETAFIQTFGLSEFEIEYGAGQPFAVLASRQIAPNFYLSYWKSLAANDAEYWIKFSYQVFERYRLSLVRGPLTPSTFEVETTFRF